MTKRRKVATYPGNEDKLVELRVWVDNASERVLNLAIREFILELFKSARAAAEDFEVIGALVVTKEGPVIAILWVGGSEDGIVCGLKVVAVGG